MSDTATVLPNFKDVKIEGKLYSLALYYLDKEMPKSLLSEFTQSLNFIVSSAAAELTVIDIMDGEPEWLEESLNKFAHVGINVIIHPYLTASLGVREALKKAQDAPTILIANKLGYLQS